MNIFEEAEAAIKERMANYGSPGDNHRRTAILLRAYVLAKYGADLPFDEEDVCWFNVQQKIARRMESPHRDSLVDIPGYARNIEIIESGPGLLSTFGDVPDRTSGCGGSCGRCACSGGGTETETS